MHWSSYTSWELLYARFSARPCLQLYPIYSLMRQELQSSFENQGLKRLNNLSNVAYF